MPVERTLPPELDELLERFQVAANEFARGNPEGVKELYSRGDDATLANPFGPPVRGWQAVSEALDYASSRFTDGDVGDAERIATFAAEDLATILEIEHWRAKVGDAPEVAPFDLRVTTTFRREDDDWKIVHRHADPISTPDPAGPLRSS